MEILTSIIFDFPPVALTLIMVGVFILDSIIRKINKSLKD